MMDIWRKKLARLRSKATELAGGGAAPSRALPAATPADAPAAASAAAPASGAASSDLPEGPVAPEDIKFTGAIAARRRPLLSKLCTAALDKLKDVCANRSLMSGSAGALSAAATQEVFNVAMEFLAAEDKEKYFAKPVRPVTDCALPATLQPICCCYFCGGNANLT